MKEERIAKMAENVASGVEVPSGATLPHLRVAAEESLPAEGADDDMALANVDQALDTVLAAIGVLDDNLPKIKTDNVPQKAAVDAVQDLLDTAIKPYFADMLKAMQIFGK
jgi:hypothetical protein